MHQLLERTLGLQKHCLSKEHWIEVDAVVELWNVANEREHKWLEGSDWVVDAIDNITTKVNHFHH
jgi:tRNA A37 threonylcarbamoyladenosine dehydratase